MASSVALLSVVSMCARTRCPAARALESDSSPAIVAAAMIRPDPEPLLLALRAADGQEVKHGTLGVQDCVTKRGPCFHLDAILGTSESSKPGRRSWNRRLGLGCKSHLRALLRRRFKRRSVCISSMFAKASPAMSSPTTITCSRYFGFRGQGFGGAHVTLG